MRLRLAAGAVRGTLLPERIMQEFRWLDEYRRRIEICVYLRNDMHLGRSALAVLRFVDVDRGSLISSSRPPRRSMTAFGS